VKIFVVSAFVMTAALAAFSALAAEAAGNADAGKAKSGVCVACHGPTGMSPQDIWPNLSAQRYGYIVKQLTAFRDGTRKDPVMEPLAKGLTDEDIRNLSAYFSQQRAVAPPAPQ
jgi:cytochrome c553